MIVIPGPHAIQGAGGRYRSKKDHSVTVHAYLLFEDQVTWDPAFRWLGDIEAGYFFEDGEMKFIVPTPKGDKIACFGDYLILNAKGELQVSTPADLEELYEPIC